MYLSAKAFGVMRYAWPLHVFPSAQHLGEPGDALELSAPSHADRFPFDPCAANWPAQLSSVFTLLVANPRYHSGKYLK